jgi:uncharacterized membrane-anchored protein
MIPVPTLGPRYWVVFCFASVLGANLGDVLSRELELGYWRGLPVLAALFGCVVLMARVAPWSTIWYWLAIVLVRAAATNLSDLQILTAGVTPTVRSSLSFPIVIVIWGVVLACFASQDRGRAEGGSRTGGDLWFWASMLAAGTLGTAAGDGLAFESGLGLPVATALSTTVLVVALVALSGPARRRAPAFWVLVVFVRTWATNVGDFQADTVGLLRSTAVIAALMVVILLRWAPQGQMGPTTTGH